MTPVELRPEAVAEIYEVHDWYFDRNRQVAARLLDKVDAAMERISADPESLPLYDDVHRFL